MTHASGGESSPEGNLVYLVAICLVATLGGLLFGYDTAVISGAIGFLVDRFELSAAWKGWTASSALFGCIVGVLVTGWLSDQYGRKKVLLLAAILFLVSAIGTALARNLTEFILFRILGGVGVGSASLVVPVYIAEISPAAIRGRMVSVNQFAIISGMLIVYFVNYYIALQGNEDWNIQQGWRWMFASGAFPALLFFILLFAVPESPRWLVEQDRKEAAFDILKRINGENVARNDLEAIINTIEREEVPATLQMSHGIRSILFIGVSLAILQQVTGINVFLYYAPEIFKGLGAATDIALLQTVVVGAVNLSFTVVAIWTVDLIGRKPLMLLGASGMGMSLFALGYAAYIESTEVWVLVFVLTYIASFALSLGPVVWVVLSEIFPTRIRGRAMSLATFCLWTANLMVSWTFPMIDENEWLVAHFNHGFSFWFYGVFCVVTVIFVGLAVPETKGKTLEEIELEMTSP